MSGLSDSPAGPMASAPTMDWRGAALRAELTPLLPGIGIEVVDSIGSTNTALLEHLRGRSGTSGFGELGGTQVRRSVESQAFGRRAADVEPWLLVAEQQTAGRGRQGRPWHSAIGASLTFSLALPFEPVDWSGLSLAVGVALADALDPPSGAAPRLAIKWPNDLWLTAGDDIVNPSSPTDMPGRKLGGVLIETVSAAKRRLAVIGIGLNVQALDAADADTGFASLSEIDPGATAPATLARIARPLVEALKRFEREGFAAFAERFAARDLLCGRDITTTQADVPHGIARGVAVDGGLLVDTAAGRQTIRSGEVSVRPALPAAGTGV